MFSIIKNSIAKMCKAIKGRIEVKTEKILLKRVENMLPGIKHSKQIMQNVEHIAQSHNQ